MERERWDIRSAWFARTGRRGRPSETVWTVYLGTSRHDGTARSFEGDETDTWAHGGRTGEQRSRRLRPRSMHAMHRRYEGERMHGYFAKRMGSVPGTTGVGRCTTAEKRAGSGSENRTKARVKA